MNWDLRVGLVSALTQKCQLCLFDDKIKTVFKTGEKAHAKQRWGPLAAEVVSSSSCRGGVPWLQRLLGRWLLSPGLQKMKGHRDPLAKS